MSERFRSIDNHLIDYRFVIGHGTRAHRRITIRTTVTGLRGTTKLSCIFRTFYTPKIKNIKKNLIYILVANKSE